MNLVLIFNDLDKKWWIVDCDHKRCVAWTTSLEAAKAAKRLLQL